METSDEFGARAGLIRAVAGDGSVWFVPAAKADEYAAMPSTTALASPELRAWYSVGRRGPKK